MGSGGRASQDGYRHRHFFPGTLLGVLTLLAGLGVFSLISPAPEHEPPSEPSPVLQPVGGDQATSKASPKPSARTRSADPHDPAPAEEPQTPDPQEGEEFYMSGYPDVLDARCYWWFSSRGGACSMDLDLMNRVNTDISRVDVVLVVAPQGDPESEREFTQTTPRHQRFLQDEPWKMEFDISGMDMGFYHLSACVAGYWWMHPDQGWIHSDEPSCYEELIYAGPG